MAITQERGWACLTVTELDRQVRHIRRAIAEGAVPRNRLAATTAQMRGMENHAARLRAHFSLGEGDAFAALLSPAQEG